VIVEKDVEGPGAIPSFNLKTPPTFAALGGTPIISLSLPCASIDFTTDLVSYYTHCRYACIASLAILHRLICLPGAEKMMFKCRPIHLQKCPELKCPEKWFP
jgi:hypothetical protein